MLRLSQGLRGSIGWVPIHTLSLSRHASWEALQRRGSRGIFTQSSHHRLFKLKGDLRKWSVLTPSFQKGGNWGYRSGVTRSKSMPDPYWGLPLVKIQPPARRCLPSLWSQGSHETMLPCLVRGSDLHHPGWFTTLIPQVHALLAAQEAGWETTVLKRGCPWRMTASKFLCSLLFPFQSEKLQSMNVCRIKARSTGTEV